MTKENTFAHALEKAVHYILHDRDIQKYLIEMTTMVFIPAALLLLGSQSEVIPGDMQSYRHAQVSLDSAILGSVLSGFFGFLASSSVPESAENQIHQTNM